MATLLDGLDNIGAASSAVEAAHNRGSPNRGSPHATLSTLASRRTDQVLGEPEPHTSTQTRRAQLTLQAPAQAESEGLPGQVPKMDLYVSHWVSHDDGMAESGNDELSARLKTLMGTDAAATVREGLVYSMGSIITRNVLGVGRHMDGWTWMCNVRVAEPRRRTLARSMVVGMCLLGDNGVRERLSRKKAKRGGGK